MRQSRQQTMPLETQLGLLAMRFRNTRVGSERDKVAASYGHVVEQLIASGNWEEMPAFEDLLPQGYMPYAFFKFWSIHLPHDPNRKC